MSNLTDTHCHLNLSDFQDDLPAVLARAWERGVERILVPGIDIETSLAAVKIAETDERIYAAAGIHPSSANTWDDTSLARLEKIASHPKVVAIGEIGLDYYRDRAPRELQRQVFQRQLELAASLEKPVSIHIRDSWEDVWIELRIWQERLVEANRPLSHHPGALHSFSGTLEEARAALSKGFYLGISGPVTFKNAPIRQELVAALPLDRILIETDAPYLSPHPYRGRRNEPCYTHFIAEKIAKLHHTTYDHAAAATAANAARLLAWGAQN